MAPEHEEELYGLFPIRTPPNALVDVVAVHGLFGNWKTTWTHDKPHTFWLQDDAFWPGSLSRARVLSYGYDTGAFGQSESDIYRAAQALLAHLKGFRAMDGSSDRPLIFVAHSLGGIVVKASINRAFARNPHFGPIVSSTKGIIFLATPHNGAAIASLGKRAAGLLKTTSLDCLGSEEILHALQRNSPQLHNISEDFSNRTVGMDFRSFNETKRYHGVMIVDQDSAVLHLPTNISSPLSGSDHISICKFSSATSQSFVLLQYALLDLVGQYIEQSPRHESVHSQPEDPRTTTTRSVESVVDGSMTTLQEFRQIQVWDSIRDNFQVASVPSPAPDISQDMYSATTKLWSGATWKFTDPDDRRTAELGSVPVPFELLEQEMAHRHGKDLRRVVYISASYCFDNGRIVIEGASHEPLTVLEVLQSNWRTVQTIMWGRQGVKRVMRPLFLGLFLRFPLGMTMELNPEDFLRKARTRLLSMDKLVRCQCGTHCTNLWNFSLAHFAVFKVSNFGSRGPMHCDLYAALNSPNPPKRALEAFEESKKRFWCAARAYEASWVKAGCPDNFDEEWDGA